MARRRCRYSSCRRSSGHRGSLSQGRPASAHLGSRATSVAPPLHRSPPVNRSEPPAVIRASRSPSPRPHYRRSPARGRSHLAARACRAASQGPHRRPHLRLRSRPARAVPRRALPARRSPCQSSRGAKRSPPWARDWTQPSARRTRVSKLAAGLWRGLPLASDRSSVCMRRSCGGPAGLRVHARQEPGRRDTNIRLTHRSTPSPAWFRPVSSRREARLPASPIGVSLPSPPGSETGLAHFLGSLAGIRGFV